MLKHIFEHFASSIVDPLRVFLLFYIARRIEDHFQSIEVCFFVEATEWDSMFFDRCDRIISLEDRIKCSPSRFSHIQVLLVYCVAIQVLVIKA